MWTGRSTSTDLISTMTFLFDDQISPGIRYRCGHSHKLRESTAGVRKKRLPNSYARPFDKRIPASPDRAMYECGRRRRRSTLAIAFSVIAALSNFFLAKTPRRKECNGCQAGFIPPIRLEVGYPEKPLRGNRCKSSRTLWTLPGFVYHCYEPYHHPGLLARRAGSVVFEQSPGAEWRGSAQHATAEASALHIFGTKTPK